jgi:hypothetical protein
MTSGNSGLNLRGTWEIIKWKGSPIWCAESKTWVGEILQYCKEENTILNSGRDQLFLKLFGLSGAVTMVAGGVGDDATVPVETQTRLQNEIILGATRKALTNVDGSTLSNTIAAATAPYFRKMTVMWEYPSTDATDGSTYAEFAIFSTLTLPGAGGGTSGTCFNRFRPGASFTKSTGSTIQCRSELEW